MTSLLFESAEHRLLPQAPAFKSAAALTPLRITHRLALLPVAAVSPWLTHADWDMRWAG